MSYRDFDGIPLNEGENIKEKIELSKKGLIIKWISIPSVLLIWFCFTFIPYFFKMLFSSAFRAMLTNEYGVNSFSDLNPFKVAAELIFENIPTVLIVLISIPFILLILAWLVFCLYQTAKYSQYSLALTENRILGRSGEDLLDSPLDEIVNVYIEQSLIGKIFNYGNLTISTKRKSITVKHIQSPSRMYKIIMSYAENYSAY